VFAQPNDSPWGSVDFCDELCPGVFLVYTPEHGGTMIARDIEEFIRKMALNGYVLHVDLAPVKELVSLQRRCANNLNQIAASVNTHGGVHPQELTALQKDYAALWSPLSHLIKQLADIVKM